MGVQDDLIARAQAVTAELAAMSRTKPGGLPNTTQAGGSAQVDHVGYRKSLYSELDSIRESLGCVTMQQLEDLINGQDPNAFEIETVELP